MFTIAKRQTISPWHQHLRKKRSGKHHQHQHLGETVCQTPTPTLVRTLRKGLSDTTNTTHTSENGQYFQIITNVDVSVSCQCFIDQLGTKQLHKQTKQTFQFTQLFSKETNKKTKSNAYREQSLPKLKISLRSFSNPSSPRDQHHKRATSQRKSRSKPRVRIRIQNLLVINIKHNIQSPPSRKIYPNFHLLSSLWWCSTTTFNLWSISLISPTLHQITFPKTRLGLKILHRPKISNTETCKMKRLLRWNNRSLWFLSWRERWKRLWS